ncbi:MAG: signal peptidase I [Actinobacteria bacterium]|nr:signal peptidase I [Actinomycetota bacterium]MSW04581.1 signal peptidase I [Actinomycetota bacterium]MSX81186.1 signal peptidase I [Actinomycetota bacterium]MSY05796.1 signal peptidase I [Actinomycetota bacterium]MSZ28749.1 signal peptidase I [Actinomycetota bacterium]
MLPRMNTPSDSNEDPGSISDSVSSSSPVTSKGAGVATATDGQTEQGSSPLRTVLEWIVLIGAALLVAFIVKTFLFQAFYIPSDSMVPTLIRGDRVLVNKLSYKAHEPNRFDIVVFLAPKGTETDLIKDLVKRVVGLPGETIEGRDGRILINGTVIEEPFLPAGLQSRTFGPVKVPPKSYFMLGDNRPFSKDSTYFGPIEGKTFVGRVFVRIWPLNRLNLL